MITWQDDMNKLPDDNEGRCKCIFDIIHPSYPAPFLPLLYRLSCLFDPPNQSDINTVTTTYIKGCIIYRILKKRSFAFKLKY